MGDIRRPFSDHKPRGWSKSNPWPTCGGFSPGRQQPSNRWRSHSTGVSHGSGPRSRKGQTEVLPRSGEPPSRPRTGQRTIKVRATDSEGNAQPIVSRWNRNGYANNVTHSVSVEVVNPS